ncbi:unnamed protein product [Rhizophagus irregularis]|nr:unnamed protein product [Rhizophagus irregularis]
MVESLKKYIVSTKLKSGATNKLCYCKACFNKLGENHPELKTIVDKTDRILKHFKNCQNFQDLYSQQEKDEVFSINKQENTILVQSFERRESFSSRSSLTSLPSQWSNYGPIDSHVTRSLSSTDKAKFHLYLLQVTISCGFPLSWINNPEVIELFKFLNPQIKLPDRKTLSNEILDDAVKEFDFKMLEKLALDKIGITLSFDGWTNVREQELMGTVLTSSDGQPYIWKACDISSERVTNIEVRSKVEEMISELDKLKIPLLAIVTDSAPAYSAARKRLQTQYRNIVFLPCYAHQINLCVGEIFKVSSEFKTTSQQALKLAVYFKNANNKYFIGKLQDIQMEIYGKCIQPVVPGDTRWNSYFNCCKSLNTTKNALRSLATKFEPPASTTRRQPTDPLTIPHEIYNIIMNGGFWESLAKLEQLLIPYCAILNILQTDKARLFEVLHGFAYLYQFWQKYPNSNMANGILIKLERRWELSQISYLHMGKWLTYYYKAWTGKEPVSILKEFDEFSQGIKYPFDDASVAQFDNEIHKYWCWVRNAYPEIGTVAAHIFGICVNAASVERLWSSMGFFHTKTRNRLKFSRVLNMAKL